MDVFQIWGVPTPGGEICDVFHVFILSVNLKKSMGLTEVYFPLRLTNVSKKLAENGKTGQK